MSRKYIQLIHAALLLVAVLLAFLVSKVTFTSSEVSIAVFIFIALFILKKMVFPGGEPWRILEAFIFTIITLFIVVTTGGAMSPFFFLVYFLVFSLSMLFEPLVSLSAVLMVILLFIAISPPDLPFRSMIPIFSLAFLAPFALLLSQERIENEKLTIRELHRKEDTYLFLSLTLKKHLKSIREIAENIRESKEMQSIKKQVGIIEKLIHRYEEQ